MHSWHNRIWSLICCIKLYTLVECGNTRRLNLPSCCTCNRPLQETHPPIHNWNQYWHWFTLHTSIRKFSRANTSCSTRVSSTEILWIVWPNRLNANFVFNMFYWNADAAFSEHLLSASAHAVNTIITISVSCSSACILCAVGVRRESNPGHQCVALNDSFPYDHKRESSAYREDAFN
jgi:hypothetical protein